MVSIEDLDPVLERSGLSYYLPAVTFGYLYYLETNVEVWFILMLVTGLIATFMYVEEEILESIESDLRGEGPNELIDDLPDDETEVRNRYAHVTPWLYFETILGGFWVISLILIVGLFVFCIDWGRDLILSGLGFLNMMYFFGWIVDQIYRRKYEKHYYEVFVED